jgi:hypothetical protein
MNISAMISVNAINVRESDENCNIAVGGYYTCRMCGHAKRV